MKKSINLLILDGWVNLALGALLLAFPPALVAWLGVPESSSGFYPRILGAVLFGIGLALLLEGYRPDLLGGGLKLGGAISINLSGALVLAGWLVLGRSNLAARGAIVLWLLVVLLVGISAAEVAAARAGGRGTPG